MQWENALNAGFSEAPGQAIYIPIIDDEIYGPTKVNVADQREDPNSLFNTVRHMISVRKKYQAFGWGDFKWVDIGTKSVAAYSRDFETEHILILNNLSSKKQIVSLPDNVSGYVDMLSDESISSGELTLQPYQFLWLIQE
jgi:maltose alpha-D-glucosyltransferase/alpha-amylase